MNTPRTFKIENLGCKVNQYECELVREGLQAIGLEEAPAETVCDLVVVNSCSVTESGGAKSRYAVRSLERRNPGARVLVTGCYAESDPNEVAALDGVERVFGNQEKSGLVPWVAREMLGMEAELPELPRGITEFSGRTRAFVKIEDGCRDNCTFCIIPSLRGDPVSRSHDDIVEELHRLAENGYQEVVFTGVHLGYYGWDRDDREALPKLLEATRKVPGLRRVKLSSIEVHEITDDLVDLFASDPVFVPHFHLPLQAGADRTLRRMRRKYNTDRFRWAVALLRSRLDRPTITTDVIFGFPGETEANFDASLAFCREMDFAKMHVFPYSVRRDTPAATFPDHLDGAEMARRKLAMTALDDEMATAWRRRFVGVVAPTLVESRPVPAGTSRLTGLTDRFLRVDFDGDARLMNHIVDVAIGGEDGERLRGRVVGAEVGERA